MAVSDFLKAASKRKKKASEVSEATIENHFVKHSRSMGCQSLKLILLNSRGFPDRTVLCPGGKIFFIEFKKESAARKPYQGLSGRQIIVRRMLEGLGFKYEVCSKIGQAEKILDEFLLS